MKHQKPIKLDPNSLPARDYVLVALINGATKSGAHADRRKDASRRACRGRPTVDRD